MTAYSPSPTVARSLKLKRRTSGVINVSGASPSALDTGLDIALVASAGDIIELTLCGLFEGATPSGVTLTAIDVATMNGAAVVNYVSSSASSPASNGVPCWAGPFQANTASSETILGGSWFYTVQAGDIINGTVTLRLFGWSSVGTGARQLNATAATPLQFQARNVGPVV